MSSLAKIPEAYLVDRLLVSSLTCCPTARKHTVKPRCVLLHDLPFLGLGLDILRQIRKLLNSSVASTAFRRKIYEELSLIAIAVQVVFLLICVQAHRPSTNSVFDLPSPLFRSLEP